MSHTKELESVVNMQGKKEAMETALEGAQTMDEADKYFKGGIINMFKELRKPCLKDQRRV